MTCRRISLKDLFMQLHFDPAHIRCISLIGMAAAGKSTIGTALARDTGWRADDAADVDSTATDGRPGAGGPFRPRGMPIPARIGLVVAVLMLLLGVAGAIAMLFIGP